MSSVQFNLLPDIKLEYLKAHRSRNLIVSGAIIATIIAIVIFVIMLFTVEVVQKKQLSDADKKIASGKTDLQSVAGLSQVLTVQSQLQSLATLHQGKHITSRIFTYLPEVTPVNVNIGRVSLDSTTNTMEIDGTADSQHTVNIFVDTLKFTTYKIKDKDTARSAFPSVVESSFSLSSTNLVSYALTVKFDPKLFSNNTLDASGKPLTPKLSIPSNLTTTRSVTEDPGNLLFNGQVGNPATGQSSGGQ